MDLEVLVFVQEPINIAVADNIRKYLLSRIFIDNGNKIKNKYKKTFGLKEGELIF